VPAICYLLIGTLCAVRSAMLRPCCRRIPVTYTFANMRLQHCRHSGRRARSCWRLPASVPRRHRAATHLAPEAHPAGRRRYRLMSGVMLKPPSTLLRVSFDIPADAAVVVGVLAAGVGQATALSAWSLRPYRRTMKRLLAYSSIETSAC